MAVTTYQCDAVKTNKKTNVPDNIDDTKNQTILTPHRQITSVSVASYRVLLCGDTEQLVHLAERANEVRVCISREQD